MVAKDTLSYSWPMGTERDCRPSLGRRGRILICLCRPSHPLANYHTLGLVSLALALSLSSPLFLSLFLSRTQVFNSSVTNFGTRNCCQLLFNQRLIAIRRLNYGEKQTLVWLLINLFFGIRGRGEFTEI